LGKQIIVIVGPTCSGKTKLAIKLAKKLSGEIISADSRQIFKYLNIGTATPSSLELKEIKHHFINILTPDEKYDVSIFEKNVLKAVKKILVNNKQPIIVGGSGLYVKAIIDGIFDDVDSDIDYRNELMNLRREKGNEYLFSILEKEDTISAAKMLSSNWKRVIRALEVLHTTGKPIWKIQQEHKRQEKFNFVQFGLKWEREELYRNIEIRVDQMMQDGLVNEVKNILSKGFSTELNSLNTVGYKEIISYLNNQMSLERAVELIKRNTRRFAKRQMTWFRKDDRIKWIEVNNNTDWDNAAEKIAGTNFPEDCRM